MLRLDMEHLTKLEQRMHTRLTDTIEKNITLKIIDAAKICDVSPSKISKFVRKLGFENFKQYKMYFSGQLKELDTQNHSSEIDRLIHYLKHYDGKMVKDFIDVFKTFSEVIIFGLGPSYISAEYFAYKLAMTTDKKVNATQHEDYAIRLANENTLLIVFSVTGKFSSFEHLFASIKKKGAYNMLVLEEPAPKSNYNADYILHLSKDVQNNDLLPFEKTRTIFFIFVEEIISMLNQESRTHKQ